MKTTLFHVRRLAVAATLLGVIVSPRAVSAQSALDTSEAGAFMGSWSVSLQSDYGPSSRIRAARLLPVLDHQTRPVA